MPITRRAIIRGALAAIPAAALAACTQTQAAIVLAEADYTDAANAVNALITLYQAAGGKLSADVAVAIQNKLVDAQTVLSGLAQLVGQVVAPTSVAGFLQDATAVESGLAPYLPGNPILADVVAITSALSAAWAIEQAVTGGTPAVVAHAALSSRSAASARLAELPRVHL